MHRTALGVLTAALALSIAALSVPSGSADAAVDVVAAVAAPARPTAGAGAAGSDVRYLPASGAKDCRAGLIALTFDDGPSASVTPTLLRTLTALRVPATFFMVGERVHSAPAVARRVQALGFTIGNHTWSHPQLPRLSDAAVRRQLLTTRRELRAHGIVPSGLMRPPYGAITPRIRRDVQRLGLVPVLWSIDSRDWAGGTPAQIRDRILGALRPHRTNLVLQHDGVTNSPNSVRAVPMVVREARRRGYCFTSVGPNGRPQIPVPAVHAFVTPGAEAGDVPIRVRLELDGPVLRPVSLRVRTVAGSAVAGFDYVPRVVPITFATGVRVASFTVPVIDDDRYEPDQYLALVLDHPRGLRIPSSSQAAMIVSDDPPPGVEP